MCCKVLSLLLVVALPLASLTFGSAELSDVDRALSSNPELSAQGIEALRARGPQSLDELFTMRDRMRPRTLPWERTLIPLIPLNRVDKEQLEQIERVIDRVAGQRYASVSRLYWYTDFDRAQEIARKTGKPILSLRLCFIVDAIEIVQRDKLPVVIATIQNTDISPQIPEFAQMRKWGSNKTEAQLTGWRRTEEATILEFHMPDGKTTTSVNLSDMPLTKDELKMLREQAQIK